VRVIVYAVPVSTVGVTDRELTRACPPSPDMLAEVAFREVQLRVTGVPLSGFILLAAIVQVGAIGAIGAAALTSAKYEKCAVSKLTFPLTQELTAPVPTEVQLSPSSEVITW
jgi:hypothetical protein